MSSTTLAWISGSTRETRSSGIPRILSASSAFRGFEDTRINVEDEAIAGARFYAQIPGQPWGSGRGWAGEGGTNALSKFLGSRLRDQTVSQEKANAPVN